MTLKAIWEAEFGKSTKPPGSKFSISPVRGLLQLCHSEQSCCRQDKDMIDELVAQMPGASLTGGLDASYT